MARGGTVCPALPSPLPSQSCPHNGFHTFTCMHVPVPCRGVRAAALAPCGVRVCGECGHPLAVPCRVSTSPSPALDTTPRCALPQTSTPEPLPLGISADTPRPAPAPLRTRREHAASRGRCLRTPADLRSCCAGCSVGPECTPCALPPALPPPYIYSAWPLCSVHPHHIPLPHPHPTTHTHTPWNTPRLHSASSPPPAA